jgi:hypothetical protein
MKFLSNQLSLNCARQLLNIIKAFVDIDSSKKTIRDITIELNKFLDVVYYILNPKNKYTLQNYKIRGMYLLAFCEMYEYLVTNIVCNSSKIYIIGLGKTWTNFLCTTIKNVRPFVHIYKVLTYIALLKANCYTDIFYIKDNTNTGKEPKWLILNEILENMYNPNLRISKSKSKSCLNHLEPHSVAEINRYMYTSYSLRQHYLNSVYCGSIVNAKNDVEHESFMSVLQDFKNILSNYNKHKF